MQSSSQITRYLSVAVACLVIAGCSSKETPPVADTTPVAPTPTVTADDVDDRVERALEADSTLQPFGLDADDKNGRVVLKGKVLTAEQQSHALMVATGAAGGVPIDNNVRIDAKAAGGTRPVDVDDLEDSIDDAFDADSILKDLDIDVDEENGGLVLEGKVKTAAQQTLANDIAKRLAGTVAVVNRIKVEP